MSEIIHENELVTLAKEGNEEAFEQLINLSLVKLKALLFSQYRLQPADMEEVIQIATVKVFKKLETFRNESSFTTWFFIILKNEALDCIRRRKLIDTNEVPSHNTCENEEDYTQLSVEHISEETALSIMEEKETLVIYQKMIKSVLNELTPNHRDVVNLSLTEEKSYKEIAEELGIPIGTVMSRLFFAKKHARKLIIDYAKRNTIQLNGLAER